MRIVQPKSKSINCGITQAYNQSATAVSRNVFLEVSKEFGLPPEYTIMLINPLYVLPEAGVHLFYTYHGLHTADLDME